MELLLERSRKVYKRDGTCLGVPSSFSVLLTLALTSVDDTYTYPFCADLRISWLRNHHLFSPRISCFSLRIVLAQLFLPLPLPQALRLCRMCEAHCRGRHLSAQGFSTALKNIVIKVEYLHLFSQEPPSVAEMEYSLGHSFSALTAKLRGSTFLLWS